MGRAPCCDKANVKRGPWSPEEDAKLKDFIHKYGTAGNWIALPQKAGLRRCGKSCRLRWLNYLRPNIKHGDFSDEEDRVICSLYANIGSSQMSFGKEIKIEENMGDYLLQGQIISSDAAAFEEINNHNFNLDYIGNMHLTSCCTNDNNGSTTGGFNDENCNKSNEIGVFDY
ncbi:hypothetical protein K7X08_025516 [Anisodus acutangulus]|uniref:Uncharacterized protein n=1 Tax=Anisodus acutangulus TaxID=402998 RepID=A0A9Q1LU72_9SOLA|nr:hypothetical protein K7X08_025516 [Anisodus acutangulus]